MSVLDVVPLLLCLLIAGYFLSGRSSRLQARQFRDAAKLRALVVVAFSALSLLNLVALLGWVNQTQNTMDVLNLVAAVGLVVVLVERRILADPCERPRRVLVVGAHPDDVELACGGTIAKLVDNGHEVRGLIMSHGASGGDEHQRIREAVEGGRFLGMTRTDVHDFPDCAFTTSSRELITAVEDAVREFQPDVILTHSAHDQHQDHHAVHHAVLRAARFHSSILCFESPSVTRAFNPSFFVDIVEYVNVKVEAVRVHKDQSGKPYMNAERIRGMSAFRGQQAKILHAEAFEPVRIVGSALGDF